MYKRPPSVQAELAHLVFMSEYLSVEYTELISTLDRRLHLTIQLNKESDMQSQAKFGNVWERPGSVHTYRYAAMWVPGAWYCTSLHTFLTNVLLLYYAKSWRTNALKRTKTTPYGYRFSVFQ